MLYEDREARVLAALDALHIEYTHFRHPAVYTMEECRGILHEPDTAYCKNLFLSNRQQSAFYLLVLREDQTFSTRQVSHQLGVSRLSFAPDTLLPEYLGVLPGAVSGLGLCFDKSQRVRLVLDGALRGYGRIAFHPCVNTATVVLRTEDFLNTYLPFTGHAPSWVRIGQEEEECALS